MSDRGNGNEKGKAVVQSGDPSQYEMFTEMAAIERERIASRNKMTEAMTAGFAHLNESDQRQFEFSTDKLGRDDAFRNRQLDNLIRFGWAAFALVAVLVLGFGYMILWGTPEQRDAALVGVGLVGAYAAGVLTRKIATRSD